MMHVYLRCLAVIFTGGRQTRICGQSDVLMPEYIMIAGYAATTARLRIPPAARESAVPQVNFRCPFQVFYTHIPDSPCVPGTAGYR